MGNVVYGYVRISTKDQNPDRQIYALKDYGINEENIFVDRLSGKNFIRPEYKRMMKKLRRGDHIVIKSIDRLGRNYNEILEQWRIITKEKNAGIEVLDMPLLNTDIEREGLTGIFIADLVLQILAYVAETEREFIRQRQSEGIAAAKYRGVKFGRERIEMTKEVIDMYDHWRNGNISMREAAKKLNTSPATFCRRCKELSELDELAQYNVSNGRLFETGDIGT